MTESEIKSLINKQKAFFYSGKTLPVQFRIKQLKALYSSIKSHEDEICEALSKDLGKSAFESYMCEIGMALDEISYMIRHTKKFAKQKSVRTPLAQFAARSFKNPVPYGNVLIMSPWNYPFLLSIDPLADAIAAGNTIILKPSAYSPATSRLIEKIVSECFSKEYVAVVSGGRQENSALLSQKFDMVFFTGSQSVGKEVLRRCAEHLTPAVLELGGKSPCIVDESADIKLAAKRIVFGKFLNCGQTCVAPDYILCHRSLKENFPKELKKQITLQYGNAPLENNDYGKIINAKHYDRILNLIDKNKIIAGGGHNNETLQIEPTLLEDVSFDDAVMQEEIFGPVLPIIYYDDFDEICRDLKAKDKPLALYLFTKTKNHIKKVNTELVFGGGCINDVIIHLATSEMGFGGVGESGMGAYHGKAGFDAFSHTKSVVDKKVWIDLPMRYQPYKSKLNKFLLRFFLK